MMCGSFQQPTSIRILEEFEQLTGVPVSVLSPGAGPGPSAPAGAEGQLFAPAERALRPFNDVLVLYEDESAGMRLRPMYWQLIHDWEKEFRSRYTCFNTRAESLRKRHNLPLLRHQRCILPVVAFFENLQRGGRPVKPRQVYDFTLPQRRLMALGGIYSIWTNPQDSKDRRYSCSIITVRPNAAVGAVHNRMPFIVPPSAVLEWLDQDIDDADRLLGMVRPYEGELLSQRC